MRFLNLLLAMLLFNGLHPDLAAAQTTNTSDRTSVSARDSLIGGISSGDGISFTR
jgi:hypothetical protein